MSVSKRALVVTLGLSVILVAVNTMYFGINSLAAEVDQQSQAGQSAQGKSGEDRRQARNGPMPENNDYGVSSTPMEYAKMFEPELGIPPIVDCGTSVEIPIYVNEVKYTGNPGLHGCDNPSLQVGDCMSGSSLQRYEGDRHPRRHGREGQGESGPGQPPVNRGGRRGGLAECPDPDHHLSGVGGPMLGDRLFERVPL